MTTFDDPVEELDRTDWASSYAHEPGTPSDTTPAHSARAIPRSAEVSEILGWCLALLEGPLADGANKRAAGMKVLWKIDPGHYAASDRHRLKHTAGERYDLESGCHHRVHSACRDLMIAFQEMVEDGLIPE